MAFHAARSALTREKRRGALSHYHGTLAALAADTAGADIPQRVRTFTQAARDDILAAFAVLRGIQAAAIVVHGAAGCAAASIALAEADGARWYAVDLSERDSILGGEAPLRATILRAIADGAQTVFVVGTPVVAINNDDVHAVLLALASETAVPIQYVNTDGFRSKSPLTGFDVAFHALLRLVEAPDGESTSAEADARHAPRGFVNLLAVSENTRNIAAITTTLSAFGIAWNLLPRLARPENIRRAGRARATISLNRDESEYFGLGLEAAQGVPYPALPAPIGLAATRRFVLELGAIFGRAAQAQAYADAQEAALRELIDARPLAGKRVFLQTDTALVAGLGALLRELGGEVAGVALSSVDLNNRAHLARLDAAGDIPALVAVGQPFELANVLAHTALDYYIGPEQVAFAARLGARPVSLANIIYYGYEGVRAFAAALAAPVPDFRERVRDVYSEGWLKKNGAWHLKREVR
ncbi:MAG: nitrogenase component 1 [Azoarcus sp.]|jgi:nitrogenase molybdenum-iron protein alpha chain|nr:nitrogenase component 1 [Azoarcus sp.]